MVLLFIKPGWPVSRILSDMPQGISGWLSVYAVYLRRPDEPVGRAARVSSPLLDLAPEKGCLATASLQVPVVSYTAISPLPLLAVCFCGPVWQVTPSRDFPGFMLCGVRTFLKP